jgi:hypothetical protein
LPTASCPRRTDRTCPILWPIPRFFARLRRLTGPLDQGQVGIVNALLTAGALWPSGWLAYALATAWHEARFTPQTEWGRGRGRAYAQPGRYGQAQYGRGLVQLTWDRNYEWADRALGLKGALLRNFDLALKPDLAVAILVKGMEQGAFTGLALSDCITGTGSHAQFVKARRIINGTDRAEDIATHADAIAAALGDGGWA